jgi:hypothetical protein
MLNRVPLEAMDVLLDDLQFFEPFRRWFNPTFGRPSIPTETYMGLMVLKCRVITLVTRRCARKFGLVDVVAVLSDPARRAYPASVDVDEDHHPLRSTTLVSDVLHALGLSHGIGFQLPCV